jgi:hypothetical protein
LHASGLYYTRKYRVSLITWLAGIGNPEACFRVGMRAVFVEGRGTVSPQLDMLQLAAVSGQQLARYVLALVRYRSNTRTADDDYARRVLREIQDDRPAAATTCEE